ncbi:MAG: peptidoglycan-binding protein [Synechococcales cyanobacterium M58_A2018_015]|nr:peptidoglycan-binding protein [Synechococcales cyanobacterium M58_A2018_015]
MESQPNAAPENQASNSHTSHTNSHPHPHSEPHPNQDPSGRSYPVLYPWDTGPMVAEMQELLYAHGYPLRVDGDFGWRTEVAVKTYQRRNNLRVDGVVGPETWASLKATVKPGSRILREGLTGADVFELQGLLNVCGYPVTRNGFFNAETKAVVMAFQRDHHLHEDGVVDSVTWTVLRGRKAVVQNQGQKRQRKKSALLFPWQW